MRRSKYLLTIIFCVCAVITVTLVRYTGKKETQNAPISATNERVEENIDVVTKSPVKADLQPSLEETIEKDESKIEKVEGVDEILYQDVSFELKNGEALWNLVLPSGIYENMLNEFQRYLEENIKDYETVTEIIILDEPIEIEENMLTYFCKLNDEKETILFVTVDLENFQYVIVNTIKEN